MNELKYRIGAFLFDNPWCTGEIIAHSLGLNVGNIQVLEDRACFEKIEIITRRKGNQTVFALTAGGQASLIGRYRTPASLSDALLLQYDRLLETRRVIARLIAAGLAIWSISPWKPSRRSPYFDALVALKGNSCLFLAALLEPPHPNSLGWYRLVQGRWVSWLKARPDIPACLVFLDALLDNTARSYLTAGTTPGEAAVVDFLDREEVESLARWKGLLVKCEKDTAIRITFQPDKQLAPEDLRIDARTTPSQNGFTLRYWAEKRKSEPALLTSFFLDSQQDDNELLEAVARIPNLSLEDYQVIFRAESIDKLAATSKRLLEAGLVFTSKPSGGNYLLTSRGLGYLARRMGMGRRDVNRCLGWPVRSGEFRSIGYHQAAIAEFMLRLIREGALAAWDHNNARYEFHVARLSYRNVVRKIVLAPDSAGLLRLEENRHRLFWLEVDRGTRRGRRLEWKLEKYFLAHFAIVTSTPIPPIWYLVDPASGNGEARLRSVVEKLTVLSQHHPGTRLRIMLTTGALLRKISGKLEEAKIWRQFREDTFSPELVSLKAGFE